MKVLILNDNITNLPVDTLLSDISAKYPELEVVTVNTSSSEDLIGIDYWNTLLLYRFNVNEMSSSCRIFLDKYMECTNGKGAVFPISYGANLVPPHPLERIKANSIQDPNADFNIINRIGAFLGLSCLGKDLSVFVSHRAADGRLLAEKTCEILGKYGFRTWRDESRDSDNEGPIPIGQNAQGFIDDNLKKCTVIILIDTPLVAESTWVKKEIDTANSELIPILPVCFRADGDQSKGSRFQVLKSLNRWLDISGNVVDDRIPKYLSDFLIDIYQRKRRMPAVLEKAFLNKGFSWSTVDEKKLYFSSSKKLNFFSNTVLSHSPLHKGLYPPYIKSFGEFRSGAQHSFNRRLLIYDGDPMNENEIQDLKNQVGVSNVDILHHQKVELALDHL